MNARSEPAAPAKTTSRGSSPTQSVSTSRSVPASSRRTLTLSETWFTTQTRPSGATFTATGSRPTRTAPACVSAPVVGATSKTSRRASGVFTT